MEPSRVRATIVDGHTKIDHISPAVHSKVTSLPDEVNHSPGVLAEAGSLWADSQGKPYVSRSLLDKRLAAAGELLDRIDRIIIDTDTFVRAGMFSDDPQLGLDSFHLVCAQEIGTQLDSFVTYDKVLARAATQAGLPVEQPA